MQELTKENFNRILEETKELIVIDIYATWCAPCRMLAPILEQIETEHSDVKFYKINVDNEREIAEMFRVESIPMIAFVKNNTFLDFSIGLVPKESLEKLIEEYK
jgi:thioredoxin 1